MPVGELLFELTGQALLDFVETLKQWHRDEDSNGFLSMANLNLTSGHELQRSKGTPQVLGVGLQVVKGIGERSLQLGRALSRRGVGRDLVEGSHDVK